MRHPLLVLLLLVSASAAVASDGVREINAVCATQTGCFPGDGAGYPVTITEAGSYRLTSNLGLPDANTDGIWIETPDVAIDLNGFAILRSDCVGISFCPRVLGSGYGIITPTGDSSIAVRNGSVAGMGAIGVLLGLQGEVTNVRARSNFADGITLGDGSIVTGCTAHDNGDDGIAAGVGSTVADNTVQGNLGDGIFALDGSTLSGNTASFNRDDGIDCDEGCSVLGNSVFSNGSATNPSLHDGIVCGAGCVVRDNSVRANTGYGLNLGGDSAYGENVVSANQTGQITGPGGTNSLGGNFCAGTGTVSSACP